MHGPIERDTEGNVLKSRSKSVVRHLAKIASEGFVWDDEKFSGYEYKVGLITGVGDKALSTMQSNRLCSSSAVGLYNVVDLVIVPTLTVFALRCL